jgi:hypothetical protein
MPDSAAKITVTKLDAAKRQLRTALRLWFDDGDPVSIHTLLAAAHEIIHTLYRRKGLRDLLFDSDLIKDEFRSKWAKSMKAAPTFFKHAQHDPDSSIEFNPEINSLFPLFLVAGFHRMGEPLEIEERAFLLWLQVNRPDLIKSGANLGPINAIEYTRNIRKNDFFKSCEFIWRKGDWPNTNS